MTSLHQHHIIVVGCGRVGAELAVSLWRQQHQVTILDANPLSFNRLGADFQGRTVQGDGLDQEALKRAGIHDAHALAAVTSSDSINIVVGRTAQEIFHVKHVVARVFNPSRTPVYEQFGLQTIASSSWAAQRIEQIILHPGMRNLYSAGGGEVQVFEVVVPASWQGRRIQDLVPAEGVAVVSLARGGRACLPAPDAELHTNDLLQVSATPAGADQLRRQLPEENGA